MTRQVFMEEGKVILGIKRIQYDVPRTSRTGKSKVRPPRTKATQFKPSPSIVVYLDEPAEGTLAPGVNTLQYCITLHQTI